MAKMEEDVVFSNLRDKLFTAVVGDVLDTMGWRRQFLPQAIGPLAIKLKCAVRLDEMIVASHLNRPVTRVHDRELGRHAPLVEHDLAMVAEVVDRTVVMDLGSMLAEGTFDEVMADPSVRDAYLGQMGLT